ncbi:MAG: DUF814 domain-containing protein [Rhodothermales bacterium]|nr:DUF814 domain-containing protein [Rhodothermales bacterium]MBO6778387.1 DUF814 domain-containing protein [Rhodothermales bacterium]
MLLGYYTLRALAREWNGSLRGWRIEDAYSSSRDELTLLLADGAGEASLRISVRPGSTFVFRQDGAGKPRRNVTPLFRALHGHAVDGVAVADRDRMLDIRISNGLLLRTQLFGSRANVFLGDGQGAVIERFRENVGPAELPLGRPAPDPVTAEELADRWPTGAQPIARAVLRAVPLFDQWMAQEVAARAELKIADACLAGPNDFQSLSNAVGSVREDALQAAAPAVYRNGRSPLALGLIRFTTPPAEPEPFESVDAAVRALVRASLSDRAFRSRYEPLVRDVELRARKAADSLASMSREIHRPSRADRYERWGHLLMATEAGSSPGREQVALADLFGAGETVTIPLDPALSGLENANRYYDRARRSRRAREEAERRLAAAEARASATGSMLSELQDVEDLKGLRAFEKRHADHLPSRRDKSAASDVPYRVFRLDGDHEVWVGRNAKQNDRLTFRDARKHDLWLHARGVPGSHTVLRRPQKSGKPPGHVLEQAASIAAWFSKARGSGLAPVIVAERKYVRSPRKAPPGTVLVEREEVLIVPPQLPPDATDA